MVLCCSTTAGASVVVVVVELVVAGATATGAGSTTVVGGSVESTVLWYEKQPAAIPHAATAAGMIAKRLIDRIFVSSIGYVMGENSKKPAMEFCRICVGPACARTLLLL